MISIRTSVSAMARISSFLFSGNVPSIINSIHSIYPDNTLDKIASSVGKLIIGVPDRPMILLFRASLRSL